MKVKTVVFISLGTISLFCLLLFYLTLDIRKIYFKKHDREYNVNYTNQNYESEIVGLKKRINYLESNLKTLKEKQGEIYF